VRKLTGSIFPPAYSSEPALSASDFFSGKSAQPKLIDLETKAISTSSAPIASTPTAAKSSPVEAPSKSQSAPANYHTPTATATATRKAEPVSAFKEEFSPESSPETKPAAKAEEPEAKSLEIEQPESEDEEPTPAPAVAAAVPAAKEEPKVKEVPAPAKSEVTAVSFFNCAAWIKLTTKPQNQLLVKKLSDKATTPTRGSALAAGYDLYSAEDKVVPANGKVLVDLQLSIAVPEGTYGRVAPRSGLGMFCTPRM
jgi:coronin-1B/1C/6